MSDAQRPAGDAHTPVGRPPRWPVLAAFAALLCASCGGADDEGPPGSEGDRVAPDGIPAADAVAPGTTYQRTIVFVEASGDSALIVPWHFENRVEADAVHRSVRGWLRRAGQWRLFMEDDWTTDPTRAPWRIVPRGAARLIVGPGDALEEIYYREGVADLSLRLGRTVAEWSGQRGAFYRIHEGSVRLADVETAGLVLDAFGVRGEDAGGAELWMLTGGNRIQLVLANPGGAGDLRAWARRDTLDLFWPEVEATWEESRSFERARRDVPVLWRVASGDGRLTGTIEAVSSHLQALASDGAILPVQAVYEVAGQVVMDDEAVPVRGFVYHFQR